MRSCLYTILAATLIGCATKPDPIAQLVARVSSEPMWRWGIYPTIKLPQTGTTSQVIDQIFKTTAFNTASGIHTVKSFKILETRHVNIPANSPDSYTAALVGTDLGRKIAVFQWDTTLPGWWSRVYDTDAPLPTAGTVPSSQPVFMTTFGTHTSSDGGWRIAVSQNSLGFSHRLTSAGSGTRSAGWVTSTPQGWKSHAGWFVYVENGSRPWAYDGDSQLLLDSETADGDTYGGNMYCNPDFPCAVPAAVVSRLPESMRKATEPHQVDAFTPAITLERALTLVKAYVLETNLDTSRHYLKSIDLKFGKDAKSSHWEAQWVPSSGDARDDGFIIRVDMDRTITRVPPGR